MSMMQPVLLILPSNQIIPLKKEVITMGRDRANDIIVKNSFVSG